jgi:hypothetical protein
MPKLGAQQTKTAQLKSADVQDFLGIGEMGLVPLEHRNWAHKAKVGRQLLAT